jgi:glycerol-3-phosphate dehydrogenase
MYDVLAMYRNVGKHKRLSVDEIAEREPALKSEALRGGATYWDAATDDARLTLVTALDAEKAGAILLNHATVTRLIGTGKKVTGFVVHDGPSNLTFDVRARVVVNATGPWTDGLRRLEAPADAPAVRGTKGVHILVPDARVGNSGALTLLHPRDQRVMFVLPGGRYTVIGTTDTRTDATPDQVRASADDVSYLLESANHFFPTAHLTTDDVVTAWAGIRPLIASAAAGAAPTDQSREHEIDVGARGMISVSGGKLTTYRSMAEEIVDVVAQKLRRRAQSDTARASLPGGDIADLNETIAAASDAIGDTAIATSLVHAHGSNWQHVWSLGERATQLRQRIALGCDAIRGELVHAIRHEHARTLADLFVRRTHVAFETRDHGATAVRDTMDVVAREFGWTSEDIERETLAYASEIRRLFAIEE